jgi:hypothetical protein
MWEAPTSALAIASSDVSDQQIHRPDWGVEHKADHLALQKYYYYEI